jgi:hypothetical protein
MVGIVASDGSEFVLLILEAESATLPSPDALISISPAAFTLVSLGEAPTICTQLQVAHKAPVHTTSTHPMECSFSYLFNPCLPAAH